jgi:hypothetical protein
MGNLFSMNNPSMIKSTNPTINPLLKLESLKNEYNLAIIEYDNAYKNFISLSNQPGVTLKKILNSKLIGNVYRSTLDHNNILASCITTCNTEKQCTGLDYSKQQQLNKCSYYSGSLTIQNSNNNNSYIKNINSVYLELLQINNRLNNIVSQINYLIKDMDFITDIEKQTKKQEINELNIKYSLLEEKNKNIKDLINKNDNLTNEYNITSIMINRIRLTYFLWVLILIIILILSIKYVFYS